VKIPSLPGVNVLRKLFEKKIFQRKSKKGDYCMMKMDVELSVWAAFSMTIIMTLLIRSFAKAH